MDIPTFIENARGTVMDKDMFVRFIKKIHREIDNYARLAEMLGEGATAPTVRRVVVKGQDSDVLRKVLGIKKSGRTRACFECTLTTRHNIGVLRSMTGLSGEDLLEEMVENMFERLESSY